MAAPASTRTFASSICHSCRQRLLPPPRRFFRTSPTQHAADDTTDGALTALSALSNNIAQSSDRVNNNVGNYNNKSTPSYLSILDSNDPDGDVGSLLTDSFSGNLNAAHAEKPHRLHVYATKHNTHLTLVQPPRPASQTVSSAGISGTTASAADQKKMVDVLLSLSAGHIGFRKAGRGSYEAAYQLAAFTFKQMTEKGILNEIKYLEVVLRGFGAGREAVTKVLLGTEGRRVRGKISKVMDATRLKLGGPRTPPVLDERPLRSRYTILGGLAMPLQRFPLYYGDYYGNKRPSKWQARPPPPPPVQGPSRFLDLPPELRNLFYEYSALDAGAVLRPDARGVLTSKSPFMGLSRGIRDEFTPALYLAGVTLTVHIRNLDFSHLVTFLNNRSERELGGVPSPTPTVTTTPERRITIKLHIIHSAHITGAAPADLDPLDRWIMRCADPT
ncbi:hypothetical protein B0A55_05730 [Friedmanniomyces simplex]|uniref:Uncharacterized protein n=1 Tax=Friedmanniomyces simplex TaxID=329884 RepID=A0A4V5NFQ6_9PEZI|nr:hypothetical protein B0A55_05730 [Friedmanniomyces simplex]